MADLSLVGREKRVEGDLPQNNLIERLPEQGGVGGSRGFTRSIFEEDWPQAG